MTDLSLLVRLELDFPNLFPEWNPVRNEGFRPRPSGVPARLWLRSYDVIKHPELPRWEFYRAEFN
jgi:hypothetical protein